MIKIRDAVRSDLWTLTGMAKDFSDETGLTDMFGFFAPVAMQSVQDMIVSADKGLMVAEISGEAVGALGCELAVYPFSGAPMAREIVFYVAKDARGPLVAEMLKNSFEDWGKARHVKALCLSCMNTPRIVRLYERWGYTPFETHTYKVL